MAGKPNKPSAGRDRKSRVWLHNAFKGHAAMMQSQARNIIKASSTTPEAKHLAYQIQQLAERLRIALEDRVD